MRVKVGDIFSNKDNSMQFVLTEKTYKLEKYIFESEYQGKRIQYEVSMWYHTFLNYWDANYEINYNYNPDTNHYRNCTEQLCYFDGSHSNHKHWYPDEEKKPDEMNRKNARKWIMETIKNAKLSDIEKLDKFYLEDILKRKINNY